MRFALIRSLRGQGKSTVPVLHDEPGSCSSCKTQCFSATLGTNQMPFEILRLVDTKLRGKIIDIRNALSVGDTKKAVGHVLELVAAIQEIAAEGRKRGVDVSRIQAWVDNALAVHASEQVKAFVVTTLQAASGG